MAKDVITVTSPLLPDNGLFHQKLEKSLAVYLKVSYISLFTNVTLPLITALQALDIKGEVITTPYSFTLWEDIPSVRHNYGYFRGCRGIWNAP